MKQGEISNRCSEEVLGGSCVEGDDARDCQDHVFQIETWNDAN